MSSIIDPHGNGSLDLPIVVEANDCIDLTSVPSSAGADEISALLERPGKIIPLTMGAKEDPFRSSTTARDLMGANFRPSPTDRKANPESEEFLVDSQKKAPGGAMYQRAMRFRNRKANEGRSIDPVISCGSELSSSYKDYHRGSGSMSDQPDVNRGVSGVLSNESLFSKQDENAEIVTGKLDGEGSETRDVLEAAIEEEGNEPRDDTVSPKTVPKSVGTVREADGAQDKSDSANIAPEEPTRASSETSSESGASPTADQNASAAPAIDDIINLESVEDPKTSPEESTVSPLSDADRGNDGGGTPEKVVDADQVYDKLQNQGTNQNPVSVINEIEPTQVNEKKEPVEIIQVEDFPIEGTARSETDRRCKLEDRLREIRLRQVISQHQKMDNHISSTRMGRFGSSTETGTAERMLYRKAIADRVKSKRQELSSFDESASKGITDANETEGPGSTDNIVEQAQNTSNLAKCSTNSHEAKSVEEIVETGDSEELVKPKDSLNMTVEEPKDESKQLVEPDGSLAAKSAVEESKDKVERIFTPENPINLVDETESQPFDESEREPITDDTPVAAAPVPMNEQQDVKMDIHDFEHVVLGKEELESDAKPVSSIVKLLGATEDKRVTPDAYSNNLGISDAESSSSESADPRIFTKAPKTSESVKSAEQFVERKVPTSFYQPDPEQCVVEEDAQQLAITQEDIQKQWNDQSKSPEVLTSSEAEAEADNTGDEYYATDHTGESFSEETDSKISFRSLVEDESSFDHDSEAYNSFAVPYVVRMLDKSCAWLEERNEKFACGDPGEPSLLNETRPAESRGARKTTRSGCRPSPLVTKMASTKSSLAFFQRLQKDGWKAASTPTASNKSGRMSRNFSKTSARDAPTPPLQEDLTYDSLTSILGESPRQLDSRQVSSPVSPRSDTETIVASSRASTLPSSLPGLSSRRSAPKTGDEILSQLQTETDLLQQQRSASGRRSISPEKQRGNESESDEKSSFQAKLQARLARIRGMQTPESEVPSGSPERSRTTNLEPEEEVPHQQPRKLELRSSEPVGDHASDLPVSQSGGPEIIMSRSDKAVKKMQAKVSNFLRTIEEEKGASQSTEKENGSSDMYSSLTEGERLAALELAERLRRRAATLKRRRKLREKRQTKVGQPSVSLQVE